MYSSGLAAFKMYRPGLLIWRAIFVSVGMFAGFSALTLIPLAQATAISFTTPIFVTILAIFLFGEVIKFRRIEKYFYDIFDIRKANYIPKPMKTSFNALLKTYNLETSEIVYFDDLNKNLKTASLKGATTVHITQDDSYNNSYVDFRFKTIIKALDMIIKSLNGDKCKC